MNILLDIIEDSKDRKKRHLEAAGERFALLLQVSSVSRGFSHDEEIEAIAYFIEALMARQSVITNKITSWRNIT